MSDLISRQAAIDALEWKWAGKEEKTMNEELKPCPFCGGNNLSVEGITFYWVECTDCNASIAGNETKEEAVEAWNRRAYVEPERKQGKWTETVLIDRQDAIKAIDNHFKTHILMRGFESYETADDVTKLYCDGIMGAMEVIFMMPPSQPERKKGKWEEKEVIHEVEASTAIDEWQSARCSVCGKYHTTPYMYYFDEFNFCPNCGAEMRGEEE